MTIDYYGHDIATREAVYRVECDGKSCLATGPLTDEILGLIREFSAYDPAASRRRMAAAIAEYERVTGEKFVP